MFITFFLYKMKRMQNKFKLRCYIQLDSIWRSQSHCKWPKQWKRKQRNTHVITVKLLIVEVYFCNATVYYYVQFVVFSHFILMFKLKRQNDGKFGILIFKKNGYFRHCLKSLSNYNKSFGIDSFWLKALINHWSSKLIKSFLNFFTCGLFWAEKNRERQVE